MMKRALPCMAGQNAALEIMDGHSSLHPSFSFPMLVGVSAPSGERVCSQIRSCLLPDSDASAPRFADKDRARKGGLGLRVGRLNSKTEVGREATAPLKGRAFKIGISKVSGSVLAAEICTGPHNRLLRRQHCSSLCSQSEGGEGWGGQARAENSTKLCPRALIMFATCSWPSLCEQSELQCFASGLRQMPAQCPF